MQIVWRHLHILNCQWPICYYIGSYCIRSYFQNVTQLSRHFFLTLYKVSTNRHIKRKHYTNKSSNRQTMIFTIRNVCILSSLVAQSSLKYLKFSKWWGGCLTYLWSDFGKPLGDPRMRLAARGTKLVINKLGYLVSLTTWHPTGGERD